MPPRHAYWTIIFGNQPTAFRSATADELLPTLRQIQSKHPDAVMMWFARGRLWKSPEESREALLRQRARPRFQTGRPPGSDRPRFQTDRPPASDRPPDRDRKPFGSRPDDRRPADRRPADRRPGDRRPSERRPGDKPRWSDRGAPKRDDDRRTKDWRPGGAHRDPRDRFKVPRDVKRKRFAARMRRDASSPKPRNEQSRGRPPKKKDEDK
jgi:hypothetical protein